MRSSQVPVKQLKRIYGINAAHAVVKVRPKDVVRAYVDETSVGLFRGLLRLLAKHRIAYHLVDKDKLEKISETTHHEGVCLLTHPQAFVSIEDWLSKFPKVGLALLLDGVSNPYNLGAILRSAAHFGVQGVWVVGRPLHAQGGLARTSEGGSEHVLLQAIDDAERLVSLCKRRGFTICSASQNAQRDLHSYSFASRVLLVLGSEKTGISERLQALVDESITIQGTGLVESLNVSVSAAVFMSAFAAQAQQSRIIGR